MYTKRFKCILKSDVILNQKSASEGPNKTLHFIPGNIFLGIVARHYSAFGDAAAYKIFHSGDVRFGDAHIASGKNRTLHVPASLFHPKLSDTEHFNFHLIKDLQSEDTRRMQLKQSREGYYDFSALPPKIVNAESSFAIKSAYDRNKRCARDEQMFGYESLRKGNAYYFEVEAADTDLLDEIARHLVGDHHIGRSKSAQYGLVEIEEGNFLCEPSTANPFKEGFYSVYADGRLIFLDKTGLPTFRPSAQDLGFAENARIVWEMSNIRTFQYSPFNWKRKCFDTDRCGIEKGSVFIVCAESSPSVSAYIGYYKNEGFGKVLYNPAFLSIAGFKEGARADNAVEIKDIFSPISDSDSETLRYLKHEKNSHLAITMITREVNKWAEDNRSCFHGDSFASQWGNIREIAYRSRADKYEQLTANIEEYLGHGVASERWKERKRLELLKSFMNSQHQNVPGYEWVAVINLANIMQKIV